MIIKLFIRLSNNTLLLWNLALLFSSAQETRRTGSNYRREKTTDNAGKERTLLCKIPPISLALIPGENTKEEGKGEGEYRREGQDDCFDEEQIFGPKSFSRLNR